MEKVTLHFTIDGDNFTVAGEASSSVKKVLKKLGLDNEIVRRVAIAMYEAEINTVIHGGGGEVDIEISPEAVCAIFTDHGPGIADIELAMSEGFSTASETARELGFGAGMGLPNIRRYVDEIQLDSEVGVGTTLRIIVNIN